MASNTEVCVCVCTCVYVCVTWLFLRKNPAPVMMNMTHTCTDNASQAGYYIRRAVAGECLILGHQTKLFPVCTNKMLRAKLIYVVDAYLMYGDVGLGFVSMFGLPGSVMCRTATHRM